MSTKWIPSEKDIQQIEEWVAQGTIISSIAALFGVSHQTFHTRKKEMPEIQAAILRGKTRDETACMNRLRAIAFDDTKKGNLTALIFYGKINHGWNDRSGEQKNTTLPSKVIPVKAA